MPKFSLINYKTTTVFISGLLFFGNSIGDELIDKKINSEIRTLLAKEPDMPDKNLKTIVRDGLVSVEGKVETRLQADRIIELINTIDDVKEIDTSKLKTTASNQYIKDAFITAAVKGKIVFLTKNGKIGRNSRFHIETTNGNVHISGKAANKQEIDTVVNKVYAIKGVKEVRHSIEV